MIELKAFAKINLSLDLVGKRDDGYHLLSTVMQTVSLCDFVRLERIDSGIEISCNRKYIPTDERNIMYKVADAFFKHTGISGGVRIRLKKHIPCGAGLGGGSSDGAAVLDGLCKLYDVFMTADEKNALTSGIGADIPFFFYGGSALCEGIGEIVTPLPLMPSCRIVIAKPAKSLSTAAIFGSELTKKAFGGNSSELVAEGMKNGVLSMITENAKNALEPASIECCEKIQDIKDVLTECGAFLSMMSGSGSAVYGVFKSQKLANKAYLKLKSKYCETYIAKPVKTETD